MPPERVPLLVKIVLAAIIFIAAVLIYGMYRTAGDYYAEVLMVKSNGEYTITQVSLHANPERLRGDYTVTLKFNIIATIHTTLDYIPKEEKMRIAVRHVTITCPEAYGYYVGLSELIKRIRGPTGGEATFKIPVYVEMKGYIVKLEPGRESELTIRVKPGCIKLSEYIEPSIQLEPLGGGIVVDIDNVTVTVMEG